jgi:DNA-binding MarR family transcriptional regulator
LVAERAQLVRRVAGARKVSESGVQAYINELAAKGLLHAPRQNGTPVTVTDAGRRLHGQIGTAVAEITQRRWGDLAAEDLATAAHVLSTMLARANQELSHA